VRLVLHAAKRGGLSRTPHYGSINAPQLMLIVAAGRRPRLVGGREGGGVADVLERRRTLEHCRVGEHLLEALAALVLDLDETLRRADSDDPADRGQRRRTTARRQGRRPNASSTVTS
jgi:hypothetical protein